MARGSIHGFLGLVLLIMPMLILSSSSSQASAFSFNVGGEDGWVVKPSEDYGHWAQRNRFQVNDTLYFKYKRGTDSVLVVTKDDYNSCNTTKPLHRFRGGPSTIKLHKSGPFYFISGNVENCKQGQKLVVVVMAVRHNHVQSPPPSSSPQPSVAPFTSPSPSKSPSTSPSTAPSTPLSKAPSTPPSKAPSTPPSVAPVTPHSVAPATPPTGFDAPAPSPSGNSASKRSFGVALGISVVVALFFSSLA